MLVKELFEDKSPNDISIFHFGFEDADNAKKAKTAFKEAAIDFQSDSNNGVHYVYFKNNKDMWKALRIAPTVIDVSKDPDWADDVQESLTEGVMDLSVGGSDTAADAWFVARSKMVNAAVAHLATELSDKGNEYNTHGPLNVAMILGEKFDEDDFEYSPRLHRLAVRTLKMLQKPHGWEKVRGYKRIVDKLKKLVSLQKD